MKKKTPKKVKKAPAPKKSPGTKSDHAPKKIAAVRNFESFQKKLEALREDLLNTVRKKKEEVWPEAEVGDEGDVAVRSLARDLVFELTDNERHLLDEVEAALRRIEKGTFGICEANGEKIAAPRLKVMPYARYCIKCQSRFEQH
jgi:DnaK suppressor protein